MDDCEGEKYDGKKKKWQKKKGVIVGVVAEGRSESLGSFADGKASLNTILVIN